MPEKVDLRKSPVIKAPGSPEKMSNITLPPRPKSPVLKPMAPSSSLDASSGSPRHRSRRLTYTYPRSEIKCLLLENIHQSAVDTLRAKGFQVEEAKHMDKETLMQRIEEFHVIGIRSKTKLRDPILRKAKRMLCIGHFCIGTDQTDLDIAATCGIPVFNSPFANTRSVAELCIANMVMLARKAGDQNMWMHKGEWKKTAVGCFELRGKTLGIVGYGHVGSQLSILGEAFGMRVIFYDILPVMAMGNANAVGSLNEVLNQSDFVSLHVPATEMTKNMIDHEAVAQMKKGSYLLNAARGTCVVPEAVATALRNGHLAGAFFDVYPSEPTDATLCLCNCPNTILTPHIGGATQEAQKNIGIDVASKLCRFINDGCTVGSVNFPNLDLPCGYEDRHRIVHVHENVPGVLKGINGILQDYNIVSQILSTFENVGYLIVDIEADKDLSKDVKLKLSELSATIKTRVIYSPG